MSINTYREAAKTVGMTPSSVMDWVTTGRLPPGPWTAAQLVAVRDRPDAPARSRGSKAGHGTTARWRSGCGCSLCVQASRDAATRRSHRASDRRLPADQRAELLAMLSTGVLFSSAVARLKVSPRTVWGRTEWDSDWAHTLRTVLDTSRPDGLPHGKERAYLAGCRCTDCRQRTQTTHRTHPKPVPLRAASGR